FTVYAVTADGVQRSWTGSSGDSQATYAARPGEAIWFWATVTTDLGWWDGGGSPLVQIPHKSHGGVAG
ncbi:MAG TPA: hypothetical protein VHQ03_03905, partial [Candidatus Dormibacteraeota bacterium]|nr:hypothetical protein [Candidatus Dormibacteraeota bacterium]